ncbi:MAG: Na(+)-translocating NADH-quinone reductase subunit A [Chitinophagales bacterium]|nr:Na(+)-translocating NADH-quinone reductase subunit A [Chitinophagales bacterium]
MKNRFSSKFSKALSLTSFFASFGFMAMAQQAAAPVTANSLVILLFSCVMILVVFLAAVLGDKIIKLAAGKFNTDKDSTPGLLPTFKELFIGEEETLADGSKKKVNSLSQGFDIKLSGKAAKLLRKYDAKTYAVKPTDFVGLQPIPKILVKEGQAVKAGEKLFFDRGFEGVFFTSPVSGTVKEIKRAAKRAIAEIIIEADGKNESLSFPKANPLTLSKETVLAQLADSGALTLLTERPFGVVPSLSSNPKSIHISAFDTAPLAVDYNFVFKNIPAADFQAGLDALSRIAPVHLNLDANKTKSTTLLNANGVNKNYFNGVHPTGNVGVQIHHVDPIAKGEIVWTIKAEDVATIGKLFTAGVYEPKRYLALVGSVLNENYYVESLLGANVASLIEGNLNNDNVRVVSGNVLSGKQIAADGFVSYFDNLVSVIEEGNFQEMFGWMVPQYARPSISPTIPWSMFPSTVFDANTNMHGEKRAFVVTGQYEEVLPMDIYPQQLIKAIIKNDFEEMEGLGIYEVLEEDLALCEFVCTSKQPLQSILRDGLDYIRSQN